jgi:twitching motility two-component system response regulator PilG
MVNVLTKNSVNLLDEAVAEARSGNKSEARSLLEEASRVDPSNDKIWLWRASLAETSAEAAYSLRQVLRIDPRNETARAWIERCAAAEPEPAADFQCPFCPHTSKTDFSRCPDCGGVGAFDPAALAAERKIDEVQLRYAIKHYSSMEGVNDYSVQYYIALAYLNLLNSSKAIVHLKNALALLPNDECLKSALSALLRRKLILVVDDSPTARNWVSTVLERNQYRTIQAPEGNQALAMLEEESFDLILLDITMPFMDGYQLCKAIKSRRSTRNVPVLMLSGHDGFFDKIKGRMAGASDYLTKPFDPPIMLRTLKKYLT